MQKNKIKQKSFKRKVHINNEIWTYRISKSKISQLTYLNILSPDGRKQHTFNFEKKGTDRIFCCDLKCRVDHKTYFDPITPSFVKEVIEKNILNKN